MDVIFDQDLNQAIVTVKNENMATQLLMKKSFKLLKSTGKYIMGLLDYEDLVFDFKDENNLKIIYRLL